MADLRISELRQISEGEVQANDEYAIVDRSNSETRKITAADQAVSGVRLLPNNSIPIEKVDVNGIVLPEDTVNTDQIVDGAVTTEKLADDAVTADKIADDAVQLEHLKADSFVRGINKDTEGVGHANLEITASQRLGITYDKFGHITDSDGDVDFGRGIDDDGTTVGHTNLVTPSSRLGITFDSHGHATVIADNNPFGRGIDENDVNIGHTNSVTAGSRLGITFDEHGHVTLAEDDKIFSRGIDEGPTDIGHTNSITAGSRLGITFDEFGHVESAEPDKTFGRGIDEGASDIGHTNSIATGTRLGITYDEFGHVESALPNRPFGRGIDENNVDIGHVNSITTGTRLGITYDEFGHVIGSDGDVDFGRGIDDNGITVGHTNLVTPSSRLGITYDEFGHVIDSDGDVDFGRGIDDDGITVGHTNLITAGTRLGITYDEFGHVESALPNRPFGRGIDENNVDIGHVNSITAGSHAGFTYDEFGHITAVGGLIPADNLPIATTTELGAVYVPVDGGLTVSGAGALSHSFSLPANTTGAVKVTYDNYGHVTGSGTLDSVDLPLATETTAGAVIVPPSGQLKVDGAGNITHAQVGSSGTYTKVTVDAYGHVTAGGSLETSDLPPISIDDIQGEITIDGNVTLGECSVKAPNICDYATCLMQEDNPGEGEFLGQFWYTPSTAQLRVYARGSGPENIWLPVGFGALQANNLRWGGTYDADTDTVVSLTAIGISEGLTAGQPFPPPSDQKSGLYFICQTPGNSMIQPNLNGINHTAGDWALCIDAAQGWVHIDANASSGGGGGSAQYLNDLLDVEIGGTASPFSTAPAVALSGDHLLRYDGGSGLWRNTDIIDGGSID